MTDNKVTEETKKIEVPDHYLIDAYATSKLNSAKLDMVKSEIKKLQKDHEHFKASVDQNLDILAESISDLEERLNYELSEIESVLDAAKQMLKALCDEDTTK